MSNSSALLPAVLQLSAIVMAAFLLLTVFIIVMRAGCIVLARGYRLSTTIGKIAAEALGLAAIWPLEWVVDQAEKALALAADYRAKRKVWRAEFRSVMSWEEFLGQIDGRAGQKRDGVTEAIAVLGLADGFGRAELEARFRHLMQNVHPDKGGSDHLTQIVIAARKTILEQKGWKR